MSTLMFKHGFSKLLRLYQESAWFENAESEGMALVSRNSRLYLSSKWYHQHLSTLFNLLIVARSYSTSCVPIPIITGLLGASILSAEHQNATCIKGNSQVSFLTV